MVVIIYTLTVLPMAVKHVLPPVSPWEKTKTFGYKIWRI